MSASITKKKRMVCKNRPRGGWASALRGQSSKQTSKDPVHNLVGLGVGNQKKHQGAVKTIFGFEEHVHSL